MDGDGDHRRDHQDPVGHRVEHLPHRRHLVVAAGHEPVDPVGGAEGAQQEGGRRLPTGTEQEPQEEGDAGQADQGDGVGDGQDPVHAGLGSASGPPLDPQGGDGHHRRRRQGRSRRPVPPAAGGDPARYPGGPPIPSVAPVAASLVELPLVFSPTPFTRSSLRVGPATSGHRPGSRPYAGTAPGSPLPLPVTGPPERTDPSAARPRQVIPAAMAGTLGRATGVRAPPSGRVGALSRAVVGHWVGRRRAARRARDRLSVGVGRIPGPWPDRGPSAPTHRPEQGKLVAMGHRQSSRQDHRHRPGRPVGGAVRPGPVPAPGPGHLRPRSPPPTERRSSPSSGPGSSGSPTTTDPSSVLTTGTGTPSTPSPATTATPPATTVPPAGPDRSRPWATRS